MKFSSRNQIATKNRVVSMAARSTLLLMLHTGCSGSVEVPNSGEGDDSSSSGGEVTEVTPPSVQSGRCDVQGFVKSRLLRLGDADFKSLVKSTFGLAPNDPNAEAFDLSGTPFDLSAGRTISSSDFSSMRAAALATVKAFVSALPATSPCAVAGSEAACADGVLKPLIAKLFHGQVSDVDWIRVREGHLRLAGAYGAKQGFEGSLVAALLSPQTLYQTELGGGNDKKVYRLANEEVFVQASVALTGGFPEESVAGEMRGLNDQDFKRALSEKVSSWSQTPAFRNRFKTWGESWLGVSHLAEIQKEGIAFDAKLKEAMRIEVTSFIEQNLLSEGGSFEKLFMESTPPKVAGMEAIYGTTANGASNWDPRQRQGILSLPAVLAARASPTASDPVQRGLMVRVGLLCEPMPPPVANADFSKVPTTANMQTRERFDALAQAPQCGSCHQVINPPGYLFEHFDQVGRWRDQEKGRPVNSRAGLTAFFDQPPYVGAEDLDGVPALSKWLATSPRARACFALRTMEYMLADAVPDGIDNCAVEGIAERFAKSGHLTDLLQDIATSDLFLFRSKSGS